MKNSIGEYSPVEPSCPTLSDTRSNSSRGAFRSEQASIGPTFVGNLYRVNGRRYALSEDEQVYDIETGEPVFESEIYNRVFDLYGEDLEIAAEIRRRAKALAHGDSAMEEVYRLHLAFTGISHDSGQPEIKAA